MEQNLTLVVNNTKMALGNVCNESNLPACILELLVKELYEELRTLSVQQLQQALTEDKTQQIPDGVTDIE